MDCLGVPDLLGAILSKLSEMRVDLFDIKQQLTSIDGHTHAIQDTSNSIYDRLEHVKVDSYVNVRVVDDTGVFPLPATVLTGLLVSAVVGEGVQHHVIVDNAPHVVVDSGAIAISNIPHTIIDSGSVAISNVPHTVVDSGSVAINNVPHVVVDSLPAITISGNPTVYARLQAWDCVNKNWNAVRGYGHTRFRVGITGQTLDFGDANTCTLVAGIAGYDHDNLSYLNGLSGEYKADRWTRSIVKSELV